MRFTFSYRVWRRFRFPGNLFGPLLVTALCVSGVRAAVIEAEPSNHADPALAPAGVDLSPGPAYGPNRRPFQGIPGIARVASGRLWATWYAGGPDEGPENYVALATSTDDGRTWTEITTVIDPPGEVRAFDPVLWIDPRGRMWWFYAQSYRWWDGRAGVWAVVTDDPQSARPAWSAPRRLADGIMMNKPTVLTSGDWLLPISIWDYQPPRNLPADDRMHVPDSFLRWDPSRVGAWTYRTRDQGATFERLGVARTFNVQFDEHMFVERRDGGIWLLARNKSGLAESFSTDGGRVWSESQAAAIPHIASRFFIRRLLSGRLLLVKHNPRMDTLWLAGKPARSGWGDRSHLTPYLSDDDGRTWHGGLVLDDRVAVSYPDGDEAADGRIFVIYDYNRKTDREILLAVFTEADVAAGRLVAEDSRLRLLVNRAGLTPASP